MATFPTPESRYTPPLDAQSILLAEELSDLAERAQLHSGGTGAIIALKRSQELVVRTSTGIAPEVGASIPLPSGVTGLCVTTRKPQTCASADAEAQLEAVFRGISARSVLSVPLQWDGEVRGVLVVLAQMPEVFNRTHVAILMTLRDVIGNKLRLCELPCDPPAAPVEQVIEIDVDTLLSAPAATPTVMTPQPAAPAPRKIPAQPPVTAPRAEPAPPTPVATAEEKAPVAAPPANPLVELFKKPPEPPVQMSPDVLCPSDDPSKYGPAPKPKLVTAPVAPASLPAAAPASSPAPSIRAVAPACLPAGAPLKPAVGLSGQAAPMTVVPPPTIFVPYRAPLTPKRNLMVFIVPAAAVVVLGLAIALYPRHKPAAAPVPTAAVAVADNPAPAAEPVVVVVPQPKSAGAPAAAPVKSAASSPVAAKREETKPAAEDHTQAAEKNAHEPPPVVHLASLKPAAKAEEPVEAPALDVVASGKTMPELSALPVAAPRLAAVRKSTLVPATLVQGKPPQYPEAARRMRLSGTVRLHISIGADGKVTDVRALTGDGLLRQAAIDAVRYWAYRPAHLDGNPIASTADVSVQFNPPK